MTDELYKGLTNNEPELTGVALETQVDRLDVGLEKALMTVPVYREAREDGIVDHQNIAFRLDGWNYSVIHYKKDSDRVSTLSITRDKMVEGKATSVLYDLEKPALRVVGSSSRNPGDDMHIIVISNGIDAYTPNSQSSIDKVDELIADLTHASTEEVIAKPQGGARRIWANLKGMAVRKSS